MHLFLFMAKSPEDALFDAIVFAAGGFILLLIGIYLLRHRDAAWRGHVNRMALFGSTDEQRTPQWEKWDKMSTWGLVIAGAVMMLFGFWLKP